MDNWKQSEEKASTLLFILLLLAGLYSQLQSSIRQHFWTDEILSYWMIHQKSFSSMLQAIYNGTDGQMPLFYVLSWPIAHLFPESELAARTLPILFTFLGFILLFLAIKKNYGSLPATLTVGLLYLTNSELLQKTQEFRGYGFLVGGTAMTLFFLSFPKEKRNISWIIGTALSLIILTGGHPYGVYYAFILGCTRVIADLMEQGKLGFPNKSLIIAYLPCGILLGLYLPAILEIKANYQIVDPQLQPPISFLEKLLVPPYIYWYLGGILLISALGAILPKSTKQEKRENTSIFLPLSALAILLLPIILWIISQQNHTIFLTRYLIPTAFGWAIILAILLHTALKGSSLTIRYALLLLAILLSTGAGFTHLNSKTLKARKEAYIKQYAFNAGGADSLYFPKDYPILVTHSNLFYERYHESNNDFSYHFLVGKPPKDRKPKLPELDQITAYAHKKEGFPNNRVLDTQEALKLTERFQGMTILGRGITPETKELETLLEERGYTSKELINNIFGKPVRTRTWTKP